HHHATLSMIEVVAGIQYLDLADDVDSTGHLDVLWDPPPGREQGPIAGLLRNSSERAQVGRLRVPTVALDLQVAIRSHATDALLLHDRGHGPAKQSKTIDDRIDGWAGDFDVWFERYELHVVYPSKPE